MRLPTGVTMAVTIAVAASVTACSPSAGSGATTSPAQTVTATPTPSPSTSTYSPENRAVQEVEDLLAGYYYPQLISCYADPPHTKRDCLDNVTAGVWHDELTNELVAAQQSGTQTSGTITVVWMKPVSVDLTSNPKAKPDVVRPTVVMRVCADYSDQKTVFVKTGRSALDESGAKARHVEIVNVVNMKLPPDATGWRVSDVSLDSKAPAC